MSSGTNISPTAHYTGHVWYRNGLSHPRLATRHGRLMFEALAPGQRVARALGAPSLEEYLLARHRAIDALLERAIEQHDISQIVEIAAGLSPRGWRFVQRYGDRISYVEADLPAMAERKRRALERIGPLGGRHRVVELDALRDQGPDSLHAVAAALDRERGTAVVTEGLLGYLRSDAVRGLWRRIARELRAFPAGRYVSDLHLGSVQTPAIRAFRVGLSVFVRGRVHLHFDTAAQAEDQLRAAGFTRAAVLPAWEALDAAGERGQQRAWEALGAPGERGQQRAHILEAST